MSLEDNYLGAEAKQLTSALTSLTFKNEQDRIVDNPQKQNLISIPCLQCDQLYDFPKFKDDYLAHLFLEHRLVIADIDDIGDIEDYLLYWSNEFKKGHELREYCTTILLDQLPDGTPSKNERYYLLSDILPQDYELRKKLHNEQLEKVLKQHQYERSDRTFVRECLYCRDVIKGLRSDYIEHLFNKHFLQLGKCENLVYIDELLDCVQNKLENLICIFCEKIFKDRPTLKEHMRKKGHKRINPDIKFYDKFYLENYKIEKPKHVKKMRTTTNINTMTNKIRNSRIRYPNNGNEMKPQQQQHQQRQKQRQHRSSNQDVIEENEKYLFNTVLTTSPSSSQFNNLILNSDESDSDWSDWSGEQIELICFFCSMKDIDLNRLKTHWINEHSFNFDKLTKSLTFYQKIKIVNYIRRQIHILHCISCNENYKTFGELIMHMNEMQHYDLIDRKQWDRPEYFFSTYEDDGILYSLDDIDNNGKENDESSSVVIISEELNASINKDAEALSMENFKI